MSTSVPGPASPPASWSMLAQELSRWPVEGGRLERLGLPPAEIEARSRRVARQLVGTRWQHSTGQDEAELAAALLYAAGDRRCSTTSALAETRSGALARRLPAVGQCWST